MSPLLLVALPFVVVILFAGALCIVFSLTAPAKKTAVPPQSAQAAPDNYDLLRKTLVDDEDLKQAITRSLMRTEKHFYGGPVDVTEKRPSAAWPKPQRDKDVLLSEIAALIGVGDLKKD